MATMYRVIYDVDPRVYSGQPATVWRHITAPLPPEMLRDDAPIRVLWRQEQRDRIQVQYGSRPELSWILPGTRGRPHVRYMEPQLDVLEQGQSWRFSVVASTVVRRAEGRVRQERVSAQEWLTGGPGAEKYGTRAYRAGIRVDTFSSARSRHHPHRAWIRGVLTVEDAPALRATMEQGLGRGKSTGMGLLSLDQMIK